MKLPLAIYLLGAGALLSGCSAFVVRSNPLDPPPVKKQVLVGPVVGGSRDYHSGGFRTLDEPNCPIFSGGGGWGGLAGVTAEYNPSTYTGVIARVMYDRRPGTFNQVLPDIPILLEGSNESITQTVTTSSTIDYNLLSADIFARQDIAIFPGVRVAVAGGPSVAYVLGGTNKQVQDLVEPKNARFTNPTGLPTEASGRRLVFYDGNIPGMHTFRMSLKAGLQAELPLFGFEWMMCPGIYYDYPLTDVTGSENWRLNSVVFMIDFRRAL